MIKNNEINGNNNNNYLLCAMVFPGGTSVKDLNYGMRVDVRDEGSIPGSGRSPGGGHSNPLQYPCLGNPVHRGAWGATVPPLGRKGLNIQSD